MVGLPCDSEHEHNDEKMGQISPTTFLNMLLEESTNISWEFNENSTFEVRCVESCVLW